MTEYCVVISGILPGSKDDASVWSSIAGAFKLDVASFAQRVAAMPLIVQQRLDKVAAEHIAQGLIVRQIDAAALPDDERRVYIKRANTIRGPVPFSGLERFIKGGEQYQLAGSNEWQLWLEPLPAIELQSFGSSQDSSAVIGVSMAPPFQGDQALSPRLFVNQSSRRKTPKSNNRIIGWVFLLVFLIGIFGFLGLTDSYRSWGNAVASLVKQTIAQKPSSNALPGSSTQSQDVSSRSLSDETSEISPVDAEVKPYPVFNSAMETYSTIPLLNITAKSDRVEITNVVVNRGNCSIPSDVADHFPRILKFGEVYGFGMPRCNIVEATVKTNQGSWTFTFQ